MTKVSIIVPIYNAEKTIHRCLDSIVNQTHNNLDIVLINDGSTDNSLSILNKYAMNDERIRIFTQLNKGVAATRNVGLNKAKGDYILFIDSDDWIQSNMVSKMIATFEKYQDCDIVFCGNDNAESIEEVLKSSLNQTIIWNKRKQQEEFLLHKRMTGMLWNKMIKTELIEDINFDETVGYGEDAQFLWKVLKKSEKMCVISDILYHHVIDKSSISHQKFSSNKYSAIKVWEEIEKDVKKNYSDWIYLAKERLVCIATYSAYEMNKSNYNDKYQKKHLRNIVKENINILINSRNISIKMKLYGVLLYIGI
ncbi:glycosyltransferase family 2 protein [Thomasclavelia spiroformis]|uniref:glycosyltransferase family 2 protein n=1 Tax=Thomasclavelia spiroformis TaxID=29348 RepID=UPI00255BA26A|nr:glycosyltransferase family A protein [Thomasclavelia spiroformis]